MHAQYVFSNKSWHCYEKNFPGRPWTSVEPQGPSSNDLRMWAVGFCELLDDHVRAPRALGALGAW